MRKQNRANTRIHWAAPVIVMAMAPLVGCPVTDDGQYDLGFDAGFMVDDWYWDGYDDGYQTLASAPIYYEGSSIPYIDDLSYDAGYWDGVWYAYNDGYFVDYHYAFILGWSEGYDNAFWPDYLAFLASDFHVEYLSGGWGDGYNDGFSEGRVFGAFDYEAGLPFDWLDALEDYESGTDLYFEEVDVGTGVYGPVVLYEYGTDPAALKSLARPASAGRSAKLSIRRIPGMKAVDTSTLEMYRALTAKVEGDLNVTPSTSERNTRTLRLETTWLERVQTYLNTAKTAAKSSHVRQHALP